MTATHDPGSGRGQARQRRHGPLGTIFLDKAERRVEDHDGQDGEAIDHLAKRHGDERGPDQHPDHQVAKLPRQEGQRGDGFGVTQRVGSA